MDPLRLFINENEEAVNKKYIKTEYTEKYVAFIDIMGMKNFLDKEYSLPRRIFNNIETQLLIYSKIGISREGSFLDQIKVSIISDSLVISINCTENYALSKLIGFTSNLIKSSLNIIENQPIFYRGGITRGKLYHDNFCVFGPGLKRAYMLEKDEAKYLRCIFDKSLLEDIQFKDYLKNYNKKSILIKDCEDNYYYINYINNDNIDKLKMYSKAIVNGDYNKDVKKKYEWLINKIEILK